MRAALDGKIGSANITVSSATLTGLVVEPANHAFNGPAATGGESLNYKANATFSDAATCEIANQVSWTSADEQRVDIEAGTGVAIGGPLAGSTTITATKGPVSGQTPASNDPSPTLPGP